MNNDMFREGLARLLASHFSSHVWDAMPHDKATLRDLSRYNSSYDINDITKEDCFTAADDIASWMVALK